MVDEKGDADEFFLVEVRTGDSSRFVVAQRSSDPVSAGSSGVPAAAMEEALADQSLRVARITPAEALQFTGRTAAAQLGDDRD